MAKYKPGTIDDEDAVRRRLQGIERKADEANRPSGSNAYGTTSKLQSFEGVNIPNASASENGLMSSQDKAKLDGISNEANKTVVDSEVEETGTNPVSGAAVASFTSSAIANAGLPVGTVIFSTSDKLPHESGYTGVWKLKTRAFIPMTDDTLYYVYERIE